MDISESIIQTWIAYYFLSNIGKPTSGHPSLDIGLDLHTECFSIASIAAEAFKNPIIVPWDVKRYCDRLKSKQTGFNVVQEANLQKMYPGNHPEPFPCLYKPTTIVDMFGNILLWYLPGIISKLVQVTAWNTFSLLNPVFEAKSARGSWRLDPKLFSPDSQFNSGVATFSPAWHQMGHEVEIPEISVTLKESQSPGRQWLKANASLLALTSGLFSVIHPEQYALGIEARNLLSPNTIRDPENLPGLKECWKTPFSGISVVSNRETPIHCDINGRNNWYDMLLTLGNYKGARFELPGIGYRLDYRPGTIVAIAGKAVLHGVSRCEGSRICVAHFMRDRVLEQLGVPTGDWMNLAYYNNK